MIPFEAVLFDFGSTLFAHEPLDRTIERLSAELARPLTIGEAEVLAAAIQLAAHTDGELLHPRDLDADVWQARWAVLYGLADATVDGLGDALLRDMHAPQQWMPYRSTAHVLGALDAAGVRIGVVSNTGWDVRAVFDHHGVREPIDRFTLSYEVGCTKPDPRIFHAACDALGVEPANTLMVGDDPRADSGAIAAGMRALLLPAAAPLTDNGLDGVLALIG